MRLETFFEKFDLFAEAPGAVAKMRELVLELAVQGKLVDQDPNDDPASELLNRLIKFKLANPLAGRRGKTKESPAEDTATNRELPTNWINTTIGEVLYVIRGASPRPKGDPLYFSETRTPYHWVKISDIRKHGKNGLLMDTDEFLTEAGMRKSVLLPKGTLVLTNSATIGVPIVLGIEGCCIHDGYLAFPNFPHDLLSQKFLLYLFHTLKKHAERNARGLAQLNLNSDLVRSFPFGLPPLDEQKRIVAKVDELMALCDRLEAQQQERETRHAALAQASLTRFAEAPTPAKLQYLFHPSYTITPADLRKSILTLAVQGKLVPQDPNDEPVEDGSHGRKRKGIETVSEKEIPFPIPPNWRWKRLGNIGIGSTGKTPPTKDHENYGGEIPFIGPGQITPSGTFLPSEKFLSEEGLEYGVEALPGDVLMVCIGGSIGKSAICRQRISFNQQVNAVRPISLTSAFTYFAFTSFYFQEQLVRRATGSATPIINRGKWEEIPIPLPPLAEQHRIVAKVDQLMALVDQLEKQLETSRATAAKLMDALVAELTALH